MTVEMLKGKIHRATVTQAELHYVGSITVDLDLLEAAGILEYEKVQVVDIDNGSRFETYTIAGARGSGMICLNGAAARCVSVGDKVILMAYCFRACRYPHMPHIYLSSYIQKDCVEYHHLIKQNQSLQEESLL